MPAKRPARPSARPAATRAVTATAPPDETAFRPSVHPRYRVLSGGISTRAGAVYHGAIVPGDSFGDADRVDKLLSQGSIEEVTDD